MPPRQQGTAPEVSVRWIRNDVRLIALARLRPLDFEGSKTWSLNRSRGPAMLG
jgi:hypothetical protein